MTTYRDIIDANKEQLSVIHHELLMERMRMDKEFSIFLDTHDLSEIDINHNLWKQYKEMLTKYSDVKIMLNTSQFYMKK